MRGFFGFLKGSFPSAPKAAKCFPRARRLALETLESRLTPSASMDNPVLNLYRVFLDRVAEAPALAAWSGALESGRITVGQMAEGILRSPEHADRSVTGAYREYLGRTPDAAGLAAHASAVERGVSPEWVDASILGSNEYFGRQGSGNIPYVQALYRDVLGREADSAGLEAHVAALARGATRTDVAHAFLTSVERGTQVAGEAYQSLLGREGTEAELGMWAGLLARTPGGSAAVWASVAGSLEGTENLSAVSPVRNLSVTTAGEGELLLGWEPPAGGVASSYTVTMTTTTCNGSSKQTQVTPNRSVAYTGLAPENGYTFSVTASNGSGTSAAAQAAFGRSMLEVGNGEGTCRDEGPRFLSAFWGLDDGMPQQICPTATALDGMPITFSWLLDPASIDPADFTVDRSDGTVTVPTCATLMPANEWNETQTILLTGDFGDAELGVFPVRVQLVGELVGRSPNSARSEAFSQLSSPPIRSLSAGPYIVDAWRIDPALLVNDANASTVGSTFIRVVWSGGITDYPTGNEVGSDVTSAYRLTYLYGGKPVSMAPLDIGDLNDGDNMHDLSFPAIPARAQLLTITLPGMLVEDPNGDPNPAQVFRFQET